MQDRATEDDQTRELTLQFEGLSLVVRSSRGRPPLLEEPGARSSAAGLVPSTAAGSQGQPEPQPEPAARALSWEQRLTQARLAGERIRRILDGGFGGPSTISGPRPSNTCWVVVRTAQGEVFEPPRIFHRWREAQPFVQVEGKLGQRSLVQGWASLREAEEYLRAIASR